MCRSAQRIVWLYGPHISFHCLVFHACVEMKFVKCLWGGGYCLVGPSRIRHVYLLAIWSGWFIQSTAITGSRAFNHLPSPAHVHSLAINCSRAFNWHHRLTCIPLQSMAHMHSTIITGSRALHCHYQLTCVRLPSSTHVHSLAITSSRAFACHHQLTCIPLPSPAHVHSAVITTSRACISLPSPAHVHVTCSCKYKQVKHEQCL